MWILGISDALSVPDSTDRLGRLLFVVYLRSTIVRYYYCAPVYRIGVCPMTHRPRLGGILGG